MEVLQMSAQEQADMGARARERLLAAFSLERAALRYQALYETLIPQTQR
jgi:hypothetical protein